MMAVSEPTGRDIAPGVMAAVDACPDVLRAVTLASAAITAGIRGESVTELCWEAAVTLNYEQPGLCIEVGVLAAMLYSLAMQWAGYRCRSPVNLSGQLLTDSVSRRSCRG